MLDDTEILTLARWAVAIEKHYDHPVAIEWAKDGETGDAGSIGTVSLAASSLSA